ncbi:MAG: hypothetical protein AAFV74_22515 [Pseudomonadota bacterium]
MTETPPTPPERHATTKPSIHLTWQDWLPYLEDSGASDADKRQLIETVWAIIMGFVDLGWEVGSSENTSGQNLDLTAALQAAVLNSEKADTPESEEV